MKTTAWLRDDETIGIEIAQMLGASISHILSDGGADGHVWKLDDGRVMKASFTQHDPAVSLGILELQENGGHPLIPQVDHVFLHYDKRDLNTPIYIMVRQDLPDFNPVEGMDWHAHNKWTSHQSCTYPNIMDWHAHDEWDKNLDALNQMVRKGADCGVLDLVSQVMRNPILSDSPYLKNLLSVANAIEAFQQELGVYVVDLCASNLGMLENGLPTIRDWGHVLQCPTDLMDKVQCGELIRLETIIISSYYTH
jgi:hypothetical protein